MKYNIPLSSPDITNAERKAVVEVLKTRTLSLGPKLKEFEEQFAKFAKRKYAVGVNSGTSALHLIVRALGIGKGDEVITSPFSFIASANCILYENARPVFVDVDERTLNIDLKRIEEKITKKTKAILAPDMFSHPVDWDVLLRIAKKHNLKVIEDSAEAVGSTYKGKPCGSFGVAGVFAFYANKQMTTGEGGVLVTDDKNIADLAKSMSNQGRKVENGKWLEHVRLGYNYRISEMQCAMGIVQLKRISEIVRKRKQVAALYAKELEGIPGIQLPVVEPYADISWFVYVVRLSKDFSRAQRDRIIALLAQKGIQCSTYFQSIHLQPLYKDMFGYKKGDFPIAEGASDRSIALPFFSNLAKQDIRTVAREFRALL